MPRPESRANFCGRRPTNRSSHPVKAKVCAISCPSLPSPCKNTLSWDESSLAAEWRAPQPRVRQRSPHPCRSLSAPGADFLPAAPNLRQTHRPARQCPVRCGSGNASPGHDLQAVQAPQARLISPTTRSPTRPAEPSSTTPTNSCLSRLGTDNSP